MIALIAFVRRTASSSERWWMLRPVALPSAPPAWIWSHSCVRNVSASTVEPPAHTRPRAAGGERGHA